MKKHGFTTAVRTGTQFGPIEQANIHSLPTDPFLTLTSSGGRKQLSFAVRQKLAGWQPTQRQVEELLTDNSTKPLQRKHLNWNKAIRIELLPSLPNKSRTRREFVAAHKRCKLNANPVTKSPRVNLHWFRQCSRPIHSAHKKTSARTLTLSQDARRVSVAISPPQVTTRQSVHL